MNKYEQQAQAFLDKHGLTFKATYDRFGRYFADDTESRSIFLLTLTERRTRRSYSTRFGASIVMTRENTVPTAYDLLACVTKSDPGTFEDFCGEYGYDTDSRSAEKTYKSVRRDWHRIERFFSAEQIDELQEIN